LLVIEKLEETVVGHVFEALVSAAVEKDCEADQSERDRDEDHSTPVEIGFGPTGFIILLVISVRLGHREGGLLRES
jgi:hypothetical protein